MTTGKMLQRKQVLKAKMYEEKKQKNIINYYKITTNAKHWNWQ